MNFGNHLEEREVFDFIIVALPLSSFLFLSCALND